MIILTTGPAAAAKSLQSCPTLCDPHRRQPARLPRPWDSPGKNTGVGCRFLLQCMKVKSESEVAQSCPTLHDPMDCSLPGSSIHGIFQARVLEWCALAFSNYRPYQLPLLNPFTDVFISAIVFFCSRISNQFLTPVLLPGKSHGWRSLVGCSPWSREESDTTERLHFHF